MANKKLILNNFCIPGKQCNLYLGLFPVSFLKINRLRLYLD